MVRWKALGFTPDLQKDKAQKVGEESNTHTHNRGGLAEVMLISLLAPLGTFLGKSMTL